MFWGSQTVFLDVGNEIPELVDEETGNSDQASDADGEETEAHLTDVETVDGWVYEREDLEEGIVDSIR